MKYVYLSKDLKLAEPLEVGEVILKGATGINYKQKAMKIPEYGWIPCSQRLCSNFTNLPQHLVLVLSEEGDIDKLVTSDIWLARTGLIRSISLDE